MISSASVSLECLLGLFSLADTHIHVFSSAVFGSYLRPDLVPANPSFYEGSSMGTISTSSIFVNVDNQTDERYSGCFVDPFILSGCFYFVSLSL